MKTQASSNSAGGAPARLLPLAEVEKRAGRSRWWIRSEINAGRFPRPVELGVRRVAFVESEVDAWIANLVAKRDGTQAQG